MAKIKTYTLVIDYDGQENIRETKGQEYTKQCFNRIKRDEKTFSVEMLDDTGKQLKYWERKAS